MTRPLYRPSFIAAAFAWLVLVAVSTMPAAYAADTPKIVQTATAQGARLLFLQANEIPIVDLAIEIDAGTRWDPLGKEGLASMTAAMAFRGLRAQAGRPAVDETGLGEVWADLALDRSASAGQDRTSLRFRFLSDPTVRGPATSWVGRVLADPAFEEETLKRELGRATAGLRDALSRPQTLATRALWQAMYPGHPYGRSETIESLAAISAQDLRDFHRQFWRPERVTIVIVGNLTQAEAQQMAEAVLSPLAQGSAANPSQGPGPGPGPTAAAPTSAMPSVLPAVRVPTDSSRINIAHPASQSHIWMGIPILARHEQGEFFALMVANHVLGGGGFTSRLTQEVREKRGLSYSVFSAVSPLAQTGPFFLGLQTQRERADEALAVVRETLEAFVRDGPTDEELEAAKKNLLGGFALRLDSNRKLLDTLAQIGFYRLPMNYLDRWTDAVSLVTKEEIRTLLRQRLDLNRLATVVVAGGAPPQ
ncbi:MAG: M16 family metallopeptidase [Burkholderiaceae bacterium]